MCSTDRTTDIELNSFHWLPSSSHRLIRHASSLAVQGFIFWPRDFSLQLDFGPQIVTPALRTHFVIARLDMFYYQCPVRKLVRFDVFLQSDVFFFWSLADVTRGKLIWPLCRSGVGICLYTRLFWLWGRPSIVRFRNQSRVRHHLGTKQNVSHAIIIHWHVPVIFWRIICDLVFILEIFFASE